MQQLRAMARHNCLGRLQLEDRFVANEQIKKIGLGERIECHLNRDLALSISQPRSDFSLINVLVKQPPKIAVHGKYRCHDLICNVAEFLLRDTVNWIAKDNWHDHFTPLQDDIRTLLAESVGQKYGEQKYWKDITSAIHIRHSIFLLPIFLSKVRLGILSQPGPDLQLRG